MSPKRIIIVILLICLTIVLGLFAIKIFAPNLVENLIRKDEKTEKIILPYSLEESSVLAASISYTFTGKIEEIIKTLTV